MIIKTLGQSPVELYIGIKRILDLEIVESKKKILFFIERKLGQKLFRPPNVAGWPGGKSWIDNSTLISRMNISYLFIMAKDVETKGLIQTNNNKLKTKSINLHPFIKEFKEMNEKEIADELVEYFIHPKLNINTDLLNSGPTSLKKEEAIRKIVYKTFSIPEFQLC